MCVFWVKVVSCWNTRQSRRNRANPLIRGFPRREPTAATAPQRSRSPTWKDCEGPDRCAGHWWRAPRLLGERPRSRWGAERMRSGWKWKRTWKSKVSFYWPPNELLSNVCISTEYHSYRDNFSLLKKKKSHCFAEEKSFSWWKLCFNSPFGSPQFPFSSLALQLLLSVICGNSEKKCAHWPIESRWRCSFQQFFCKATSSE